MTPDQFEVFVARIREPYASMVYVAVYTGLRVSELVGLRWRNVHADSITIEERYCRGDWGAPKSESSSATVPVNACVIERIMGLKSLEVRVKAGRAVRRHRVVKSGEPDDLVFQSLRTGAPMRDNNILVRQIKPAARELKIGWVNWRVLRTSFATWLIGARWNRRATAWASGVGMLRPGGSTPCVESRSVMNSRNITGSPSVTK